MITTDGKLHIKRYLAGFVPAIAQSIAFGIGTNAEAVGNTRLHFEAGRVDIALTSYDFVNNRLIYKAVLPDEFSGTIYEAAIFSTPANTAAGEFGSRLLATMDSATEDWVDASTSVAGTFTTGAFNRMGADSLTHTPAANLTKTDMLTDVAFDLSGYSGSDKFIFAFNVGNANTSAVRYRFFTDTSNYYTFTIVPGSAGYKIVEMDKSAAVATGSPSWDNISLISIATTSGAGGASQVQYDGIRIEDVDTVSTDYVMVAREVLVTPFVKEDGKIQEIEFSMDVSV